MPASQLDFLIIGQGLAGSILAFELIERGQTVFVIDNAHMSSSSKVAAGIINPITGHRLNLTDGFVEYYQTALHFYQRAAQAFGQPLISEIGQKRLIKNQGQANYFEKRLGEVEYQNFLQLSNTSTPFRKPDFGCATISKTSLVDTKAMLRLSRNWLAKKAAYQESNVDYSKISFSDNAITYLDISASKLIFCEGYQAQNNPWLNDLPFKLAKGEVLTVKTQSGPESMLNWGNWLVPNDGGTYKLGSSYDWKDTSLVPTAAVTQKLLESLEQQTNLQASLIDHEVGVRPTTTDRNAFVGEVSSLKNTYCFNGFGSKGCLTIPAHAQLLCEHLLDNKLLPEKLTKWL